MAITITSGSITSTGGLTVNNSAGTVNQIDTVGRVLKNLRPSFRGYPNAGTGTGQTWSNYSMQLNTTNSGFNASTGIFTAPKAGVYVFSMWGISHQGNTDCRYSLMKNGNTNSSHCITSPNGGNYSPVNVTVAWYMNVGDNAGCTVYSGGVAHNGDWNGFSGHYVG
jgi:hypothetical protein